MSSDRLRQLQRLAVADRLVSEAQRRVAFLQIQIEEVCSRGAEVGDGWDVLKQAGASLAALKAQRDELARELAAAGHGPG